MPPSPGTGGTEDVDGHALALVRAARQQAEALQLALSAVRDAFQARPGAGLSRVDALLDSHQAPLQVLAAVHEPYYPRLGLGSVFFML